MKIIERDYLDTLKKVRGSSEIKVITGVRRSGKSTLLRVYEEFLAKTIKNVNIVHIDFNDISFENLREYHALHDYIMERYDSESLNYLIIDEVQMCKGFELAINSLHNAHKFDIYLTGSNAFLLSSDLATLFAGRVFTIEVMPFSFKEFIKYHEIKGDRYEVFEKYLIEGGFAGAYRYDDIKEKYRYLSEVYNTMVIRDIEQKYDIQNVAMLNRISDFLMNNISRLTTGRGVTNFLISDGENTNNKTVGAYLDYFCKSYAFYKVKRYDVNGKKYLSLQDKYYLCDHALKYAKLGTRFMDYGSAYENIVAIELMRRGYEVYVGVVGETEVDFVAKMGEEKIYIQVSYDILNEKTFDREVKSLLEIRDAYPKMIIARTRQPEFQYEGIKVVDIADWLVD